MRVQATTQSWALDDRVERWREEFGRIVVQADVVADAARPRDFLVSVDLLTGERLSVGRMNHRSAITARTRRRVRDGAENLTFFMMTAGSIEYRTEAHSGTLVAGELALFSHTVATQARWNGAEALVVLLPRTLVADVFDAERRTGEKLPAQAPEAVLLRAYAEASGRLRELPALAENQLAELVRSNLAPSPAQSERAEAAAVTCSARLHLMRSVLSCLSRRLDLDLIVFARVIGVSPRTVQRDFASEGSSFGAELTAVRLEAALTALQTPGAALRRISDIAFEVGFSDLSSFNHGFRKRFNRTPSEARAVRFEQA